MRVLLYGANGWTGSLIAEAISRRGFSLVVAGRNREKLEAMRGNAELQVASIDALDLGGIDVVVNCAGPYRDIGAQVIDNAVGARCHYFDVSGEQAFVRNVQIRYSREKTISICPGFAAKGVFGDWAAHLATRALPRVDEVTIAYAHGLREYLQTSPGSILAMASEGLFKTRDEYDDRGVSRTFDFPAPLGRGDALLIPTVDDISIPRHVPTSRVRSYMAVEPGTPTNRAWAAWCTSQVALMPALASAILANPELVRLVARERPPSATSPAFGCIAEATAGDRTSRLAITLHDGYRTTADLLVYAIDQLANAPRGVLAPAQLCDPEAGLAAFVRAGKIRVFRGSA